MTRYYLIVAALAVLASGADARETSVRYTAEDLSTWQDIRPDIFGDRVIHDGTGLVDLDAPFRAENAAVTPISVKTSFGPDRKAVKLTLVIDENPAPVAAVFTFGPSMRRIDMSTRVRVDRYSHVRAIVETDDGKLFMASSFVRASGGCSAPAVRSPQDAKNGIGEIRMRRFAGSQADGMAEAQVQIRHPNYSGLQKNQLTHLYIPSHFVDSLKVSRGGETIFLMEAGISISENPSFRFRYETADVRVPLQVSAADTEGAMFSRGFPAAQR